MTFLRHIASRSTCQWLAGAAPTTALAWTTSVHVPSPPTAGGAPAFWCWRWITDWAWTPAALDACDAGGLLNPGAFQLALDGPADSQRQRRRRSHQQQRTWPLRWRRAVPCLGRSIPYRCARRLARIDCATPASAMCLDAYLPLACRRQAAGATSRWFTGLPRPVSCRSIHCATTGSPAQRAYARRCSGQGSQLGEARLDPMAACAATTSMRWKPLRGHGGPDARLPGGGLRRKAWRVQIIPPPTSQAE